MRHKDPILLIYGGAVLDVDDQTSVGFSYESNLLLGKAGGKGRSFDLSVPATVKNTKIFNYDREPVMSGVRKSVSGSVVMSGVNLNGRFFLTQYSSNRYNILFVYGKEGTTFDIPSDMTTFSDTLTIVEKDYSQDWGTIPNFGFYQYGNGTHVGEIGDPLTLFPCTNLGYIIDTLATSIGWSVNYPDAALGRGYQAHAYGLILPEMHNYMEYSVRLVGSGYNGWTPIVSGGYTLDNVGLKIEPRVYKRGDFGQNVIVKAFVATKPIRIVVAAGSNVVFATGNGYTILNNQGGGQEELFMWNGWNGCDFTLETGSAFIAVSPSDWHHFLGGDGSPKWNGPAMVPAGYTTVVGVDITVYGDEQEVHNGDILNLGLCLPDMTLREYLDAYCNLICACWTTDETTKMINILPLDMLIDNIYEYLQLDKSDVYGIESVKRYIDGWARHNYTLCESEDYVTEECRFRRDTPSNNDYLDESRDVATIPFNDGNWRIGSNNVKLAVFEDVVTGSNNSVEYKGVLSVIFENTVNTEGALHVQTAIDLGVGYRYATFTGEASTVEVRSILPFRTFAALEDIKGATMRGEQYAITSAQWGEGVARLTMLSVQSSRVPSYLDNILNFRMPDGGTITLTRNGNPTAVTLEYSINGGVTWTEWQEVGNVRTLTLAAGQRVHIRNTSTVSTGFSTSGPNYYRFYFDSSTYGAGNTDSLLCVNPEDAVITSCCYQWLFRGCNNLYKSPNLPSVNLATYCYYGMFGQCTSLVVVPDLPASVLKDYSYYAMFDSCTSLSIAPKIFATELAGACCGYMFAHCTSLVVAPVLMASVLKVVSYVNMFDGCTSLNDVTLMATDISSPNCLQNWLNNVSSVGSVHCDALLPIQRDSASGVPVGWSLANTDPAFDPTDILNFEMPNGGTITLTKNGTPTAVELEYSTDGGQTWQVWQEVSNVRTLTLEAGGKVYIRNTSQTSTGLNLDTSNRYVFAFSDDTNADGTPDSLLCCDPADAVLSTGCFFGLFRGAAHLLQAPRLPQLTLESTCYSWMFAECVDLTHAADMDAVMLASDCCRSMYQGCTSLVQSADCPATASKSGCYRRMYYGCSSLVEVSTHLNEANTSLCLYQWLYGVPAAGDFYKKAALSLPSGDSGIPSGWTVHNTIP